MRAAFPVSLSLAVTLALFALPSLAQVKLDGAAARTPRHQVMLDKSGLPAQIVIEAAPSELPLPLRAPGATPAPSDLTAIGRGPQLRAPIRFEALLGGQKVTAEPVKPAQPVLDGGVVACQAELRAGALKLALGTQVGADGSLQGRLTYGGQNVEVEKLDLVVDLAGPVDTVVAGPPVGVEGTVYPPAATEVEPGEGVVWKNSGMPTHCFLGNGDRGFTWLTPTVEGFAVDPKLPAVTVERDKEGAVTWRISLVNSPAKMTDERTLTFSLLVHPARTNAALPRAEAWKPWTGTPALPALSNAARKPGLDLVRADLATVHEAFAERAVLEGPGGGDAASAVATLADTFPAGLFRYLAASHTALPAQVRANARKLSPPGASPGCDRMVLGRALLHDIGVDLAGLGQQVAAANLLKGLEEFGYFTEDGKTEFLPYWRAGGVVRYGESFVKGDQFAVTEENPMARVRVSVFLRPAAKDPTKTQALFVVVNEGDKPVREQFYILQPERCFGGPNTVSAGQIIRTWNFAGVPKDSDWRQEVMVGSARPGGELPPVHLRDMEDNGFVQARSREGGMEIYGLLYVPARGMRVLYGAGGP